MLGNGGTWWDGLDGAQEDLVVLFVLVFDGGEGVAEHPQRQGEVHEGVLVDLVLEVEDVLDDLDTDCADHHCGCRGDGRDNLTSDELDLEVIDLLDLVVPGSEVGDTAHLLNVEVGGIILLKLNKTPGATLIQLLLGQLNLQSLHNILILLLFRWLGIRLGFVSLDGDLLRHKLRNNNVISDFGDFSEVALRLQIEDMGEDVGGGLDEL